MARVKPGVQALGLLLRQETELMERLLLVARGKRDAILAKDHKKVEEAVSEEARLLAHVHDIEERRAQWVAQWQAFHGHERIGGREPDARGSGGAGAKPPTLKEILDKLPENEAKDLRTVADTLSSRLSELDDVNRQNAGLLYHSLAYVQAMLSTLTEADSRGKIYGPQPRNSREQVGKAILDWRA